MPDETSEAKPQQQTIADADVVKVASVGAIDMPEVNRDAVAAAQASEPPAPSSAPSSGPVDRHGNAFDAKVHECDAGGAPIVGNNGKLKIRRGGDMRSKSKVAKPRGAIDDQVNASTAPGTQPPPSSSEPPAPPVDYRKVAETWMNPALDTVTASLGAEWDFEAAERERFVQAGARLAARWDVKTEMHPLAELIALSVAAVKVRSELPKTKAALDKARSKIASWWESIWLRITGRRATAPPPQPMQRSPESTAAADAKPVEFRVIERGGSPRVDPATGEPMAR